MSAFTTAIPGRLTQFWARKKLRRPMRCHYGCPVFKGELYWTNGTWVKIFCNDHGQKVIRHGWYRV